MKPKTICIIFLLFLAPAALTPAAAQGALDNQSPVQDRLSPSYPWFGFNFTSWTDPSALPFNVSQARSFFSQYYYRSGTPVVGIISAPARFDIQTRAPQAVYLGSGQQLTYNQYASTVGQYLTNQLFIQGQDAWTQYIVAPADTWLQLVAYVPSGGSVEFYDVVQRAPGQVTTEYRQYQFNPGYNTMSYMADEPGRHMIFFVLNSLPSNALVVDVLEEMPTAPTQAAPGPGQVTTPPAYQTTQTTQPTPTLPSPGQTAPPAYQPPAGQQPATPTEGDTPVTVRYPGTNPFQLYVDGALIGTFQGSASFNVRGGMYHTIRVFDGIWPYERTVYVDRGIPKIIFVEAV